MNANEIQMIKAAGGKGGYVSPKDIARLCDHTLQLRKVMHEVRVMLARTAPSGTLKAMVDIVMED